MGLAAFPIFCLAALSPLVVAELGISRTAFGAVSTTMFSTAILVSLVIGKIVDRLGPRVVLGVLYVAAAIASILFSNASSVGRMLVAGVVVGFAQAAANPATNAVIVRWVPSRNTGTLVGLKQSGVPLTQFAAGGLLAPIAAVIGWRPTFLLGLLVIVPSMLLTLWIVPKSEPASSQNGSAWTGIPPTLRWLFGCMFLLAMALQAANVYIPLFAFEAVGTSAVAAGVLIGTAGLVGMISRVALGRLAGRHPEPVRIVVLIAVVAIGSVLGLISAVTLGPVVLWISALLFAASVFGFNVVGMTVVLQAVDRSAAGRATGALATVMFTGFALGPIVFGSLVDLTESYRVAWSFVLVACSIAAVVSLRELTRSSSAKANA
jgi:MFS family permease